MCLGISSIQERCTTMLEHTTPPPVSSRVRVVNDTMHDYARRPPLVFVLLYPRDTISGDTKSYKKVRVRSVYGVS